MDRDDGSPTGELAVTWWLAQDLCVIYRQAAHDAGPPRPQPSTGPDAQLSLPEGRPVRPHPRKLAERAVDLLAHRRRLKRDHISERQASRRHQVAEFELCPTSPAPTAATCPRRPPDGLSAILSKSRARSVPVRPCSEVSSRSPSWHGAKVEAMCSRQEMSARGQGRAAHTGVAPPPQPSGCVGNIVWCR